MEQSPWNQHYDAVAKKTLAPAATLSFALEQFKKEGIADALKMAIDLGFGNGIDSLTLLDDGWHVMAIDKELSAIDRLKQLVKPSHVPMLDLINNAFEEVALPPSMLINASFSLPFCSPQQFPVLWKNIVSAIQPGGRFAGHFFGMDDSWSARENMTFHTTGMLQELFTGFSIEKLEETKREGRTIRGAVKHWHVYHIVAHYQ